MSLMNHRTRDPRGSERREEIDAVLDALRELLHAWPSLRIGQAITGALGSGDVGVWCVEDDALLAGIKRMQERAGDRDAGLLRDRWECDQANALKVAAQAAGRIRDRLDDMLREELEAHDRDLARREVTVSPDGPHAGWPMTVLLEATVGDIPRLVVGHIEDDPEAFDGDWREVVGVVVEAWVQGLDGPCGDVDINRVIRERRERGAPHREEGER